MNAQVIESIAARLDRIAASWPQLSECQTRTLRVMAMELERETGRATPQPIPKIGNVQPR